MIKLKEKEILKVLNLLSSPSKSNVLIMPLSGLKRIIEYVDKNEDTKSKEKILGVADFYGRHIYNGILDCGYYTELVILNKNNPKKICFTSDTEGLILFNLRGI